LQDFAYAHEGRNRVIGSPGHNSTVDYLVEQLTALNYYDVEVQPFTVPSASASLGINGQTYEVAPMTFTSAGSPNAPFIVVANLGCDAVSRIMSTEEFDTKSIPE
jgi:carboxypeptidase Q